MAFSLGERFPPPPKSYNLLEPGAYQTTNPPLLALNKVPFLSKSARGSAIGNRIWTHALYDAAMPPKITNCASLLSKVPRFPYEALSKEDMEAILCQCGIENPCECSIDEQNEKIICQGKVQRRLFKGPVPKSTLGEGISAPSKKDYGFKVLPNGTKIRIFQNVLQDSPPIYDARVIESTAFYQGCKWSKWTSGRQQKLLEARPGPASYTIENEPSYQALCAEKVRALKRKTSKQYRFIEMMQRSNILDKKPGPADYTPNLPNGVQLKWLGAKAERFATGKYDVKPGPSEYHVKRDFDRIEPPQKSSHAKLAAPAFFGVKAIRFKPRCEEGAGPASYDPHYIRRQSKYCNLAPFGSSTKRFKNQIIEDDEAEDDVILIENTLKENSHKTVTKEILTWGFKSKTIRMKPLSKLMNEPSPADLAQSNFKVMRSHKSQYNSPFFSSEGRFQPWFNWIPVHGKEKTPGPAYYCLDKPKCLPAVNCGPLYRTQRFPITSFQTPAPSAYKVDEGMETILATHNQKLKDNIANKHEFHWSLPLKPTKISIDAKEAILLNKSIALLDIKDVFEYKEPIIKKPDSPKTASKDTKLLRCFLQSRKIPTYF